MIKVLGILYYKIKLGVFWLFYFDNKYMYFEMGEKNNRKVLLLNLLSCGIKVVF